MSASEDGTVRLWDYRQKRAALTLCLSVPGTSAERGVGGVGGGSRIAGTGSALGGRAGYGSTPLFSLAPLLMSGGNYGATPSSSASSNNAYYSTVYNNSTNSSGGGGGMRGGRRGSRDVTATTIGDDELFGGPTTAAESQGRMLAVGAADGTLCVVDIVAHRMVASTVSVHGKEVRSLSTRGRLLLSASSDGTVAITALTFPRNGGGTNTPSRSSFAEYPYGEGGGGGALGVVVGRLRPALGRAVHRNKALCARWHPGGEPLIVTSSADHTAVVWRVSYAEEGGDGTDVSRGEVVGGRAAAVSEYSVGAGSSSVLA